jgi:CBS domain-containing protein
MAEVTNVGSMPVSMLVGDGVVHVEPDASLWDVADALTAADIGVLAVTRDDAVIGIVSERDLAHALAERRDLGATHASDIAHAPLISCDVIATVAEVATEMMEHWVRHVVVEQDGQVVGIVSARDLLAAYASADMPID